MGSEYPVTVSYTHLLLAIPFFVLAGSIMNNGGIAKRLIGCARLVAHRLPGDLAQTNIVANMLFGAISGSGVAAASATVSYTHLDVYKRQMCHLLI